MSTIGPFAKRSATLLILSVFAISVSSADDQQAPRIPPAGMRFDADIPYGSDSPRQRLDVLYFNDTATPRPCVIYIHGGGWYLGDKGGQRIFDVMKRLGEQGFVTVTMNYRFSEEAPFPAALHDCKRAVRWLRDHAISYGIDPRYLGAIGESAGGHLSAMLALTRPTDNLEGPGYHDQSSGIQAAVPVCAPFDFLEPRFYQLITEKDPNIGRFLAGEGEAKKTEAAAASPIRYVHADAPPLMIVHGTADKLVPLVHATAMSEQLAAAGSPHELLVIGGGGHGMSIARDEPMLSQVVAFFVAHLIPQTQTE